MEFPRFGTSGNLLMTQVGDDLYRVEEQPWCLLPGAHRGDVLRLRESESGSLVYVKRVEKTSWRTWEFLLSRELAKSERFERLTKDLERLGCDWSVAFGGMFAVHAVAQQG